MAIPPNKPGDSHANWIVIPSIVFLIVSPILVALRSWSRLRKGGKLGADDYTIMAALACSIASSGVEIASAYYGFGQHIYNLDPSNKANALMYFYICQITYKTSINLTKCCILLLYIRIFGNIRIFKIIAFALITIIAMYGTATVTATIFQCQPLQRAYDKTIPGQCIDNNKFWWANACFSVATDIIILCLPMPLVYKLQIPRIQKAALMVVFALGGFVVVTSCLRMTTINLAATSPDSTYDIASTMWTVIEMNLAIVCACLPIIRPLIVKLFPRLMPKSSGRRTGGASKGVVDWYTDGSRGRSRLDDESGKWYGISSQNHSDTVYDKDVGGRDINLATIGKGSSEYILSEDKADRVLGTNSPYNARLNPAAYNNHNRDLQQPGMAIHKTVQYSVEYSRDKQNK